MNDITSPPMISVATAMTPPPPLGQSPGDTDAIPNTVAAVEAILRQPRRVFYHLRQSGVGRLIAVLFGLSLVCSLIYGLVVGSFSMGQQLFIAPAKIAAGLLVGAIICLPSLYIFACLSGSQARLVEMIGLLAGMITLSMLLLIGFAPVAWLFSQSTQSLCWMGSLHLLFWFIATCFGIKFLNDGFAYSRPSFTAGLNTWMIIFILVVLQMTTALRPILGTAETVLPAEKKFFLVHWMDCLKKGE
jgi:hypothetical protein